MRFIRNIVPFTLAVLSLALAVYHFAVNLSTGERRDDEMVTKWEDHVQALKDALPSGLTQIGYMDDSAISGDVTAFDINEFQLMQYSIAPIALDNGIDHAWIIGNIQNDVDLEAWLTDTIGAHEVQNFGFGLYLIHDLEN